VASYEDEVDVLARMIEEMRTRALANDIEAAAQRLGRTPYEIITIASLIEKEVKIAEERALVSRVIHNRLELDMELQIDAALYYGAAAGVDFATLKEADSPYNLYRVKGLPPTPIANPGEAALIAAMNPADDPADDDERCTARTKKEKQQPCRLLFYVLSDAEGRHAFSTTYRTTRRSHRQPGAPQPVTRDSQRGICTPRRCVGVRRIRGAACACRGGRRRNAGARHRRTIGDDAAQRNGARRTRRAV
jgi:cell division protein YceG involved in septum cleavage